jgi:alkanesulfonate monooxygenase SsuD/methylene tetrahydromethanopterin reductase-like flavin-dependent oxidoreductase (luciferase family)
MRYGLCFPNGGACADARTLAELAHLAEGAGWDGVFLEDYIVWQGHQDAPTYDPWVALAAMAMQTEKIRLGTQVTPLSRRRPWKVARETVTLDHLSNGRLILGVGLGDTSIDVSFTHFAEVTDARQRSQMLDQALDVLVGLWKGFHSGSPRLICPVRHLGRRAAARRGLGAGTRIDQVACGSRRDLVDRIYSSRDRRAGCGARVHRAWSAAHRLRMCRDFLLE